MGPPLNKNKVILRKESIFEQAESFLNEGDYQLFLEIITQVTEGSLYLGDGRFANNLIDDLPEICSLIIQANAPLEPEVFSSSTSEAAATGVSSLIIERRISHGIPLDSGIVPTIVKNDWEILFEFLDEKLPYMTDSQKQTAVEEFLKVPPGAKRNLLLKVFLIKNKKYSRLDPTLIQDKIDEKIAWFIENSQAALKGTVSLFDPFQLIEEMGLQDLKYLINRLNPDSEAEFEQELILEIYEAIQSKFATTPEEQRPFENPIDYLWHFILVDHNMYRYFERFDFISKYEFRDIFADFCADYQINAYDLLTEDKYSWDLYLTKKTSNQRNAIAVLLRGFEAAEKFQDAIENLKEATKYCTWIYLITTPLGVLNIGLDKLLSTAEEIGAWVYIVDPTRGIIYGLLKGKNSPNILTEREKELVNTLKFPLRPLDPQKQYSKYFFDKSFRFKPHKFMLFGRNPYLYKAIELDYIERDRNNLQYLLIFHKEKGVSLNFIEWVPESLDPDLVSGLISAMENFGNSFGEMKSLQEIQYSGFTITFAEGESIKACLFLKEKPSPRLKELLKFAVNRWESLFRTEIEHFRGSLNPFKEKNAESISLLNQIFLGMTQEYNLEPVIPMLPLPV